MRRKRQKMSGQSSKRIWLLKWHKHRKTLRRTSLRPKKMLRNSSNRQISNALRLSIRFSMACWEMHSRLKMELVSVLYRAIRQVTLPWLVFLMSSNRSLWTLLFETNQIWKSSWGSSISCGTKLWRGILLAPRYSSTARKPGKIQICGCSRSCGSNRGRERNMHSWSSSSTPSSYLSCSSIRT